MVMTIPEDFSANAATLTQETPKKMEIFCETNPGTNYIASKMSGTAMKEIKSSVRKEVTKVYAQVLFDSMQKAEKGMKQASEGADSLEKGAEKVVDGNNVLTQNLDRLCDSTLMFQEGSETLAEGIRQYTGGLKEAEKGAVQLEENLVRLSGAYGDLSRGVSDLQNGTATKLVSSEFFTLTKYEMNGENTINNDKPFQMVTVIKGNGTIDGNDVKMGDNFVVCSDQDAVVYDGNMTVMICTL